MGRKERIYLLSKLINLLNIKSPALLNIIIQSSVRLSRNFIKYVQFNKRRLSRTLY